MALVVIELGLVNNYSVMNNYLKWRSPFTYVRKMKKLTSICALLMIKKSSLPSLLCMWELAFVLLMCICSPGVKNMISTRGLPENKYVRTWVDRSAVQLKSTKHRYNRYILSLITLYSFSNDITLEKFFRRWS